MLFIFGVVRTDSDSADRTTTKHEPGESHAYGWEPSIGALIHDHRHHRLQLVHVSCDAPLPFFHAHYVCIAIGVRIASLV